MTGSVTYSLEHTLGQKLDLLRSDPTGLDALQRGIEKESLRITPQGNLSQTPHPPALGAALTHPSITTDFSEAQLELITGVHPSGAACLQELTDVHAFVFGNLEEELLWPSSMPCLMGGDEAIRIGEYGSSNIGQAKNVYRRGLGVRYGRLMQTISGIHYNFSVPDRVWQSLSITSQEAQTEAYFGLIRNFRRWSWLLIYAFGASPAVCKSFTQGKPHNLQDHDDGSFYLPYATSLRMGPLGYQSNAQTELHISYNSLEEYARSMINALTTEYAEYADKGVIQAGQYQQLNTAILQIENEFYGTIRPKRTAASDERPVTALTARGVEYVEVRCIDLNPFLPVGIDLQQIDFNDTFLMLCLLADSPPDSKAESIRLAANQKRVVEQGRNPSLTLVNPNGDEVLLREWAEELLSGCAEIAEVLDSASDTDRYTKTTTTQRHKVEHPESTPSAQVLAEMQTQPFFKFSMARAEALQQSFAQAPLQSDLFAEYVQTTATSLEKQAAIEAADKDDFSTFLEGYLAIPG
jgi:glutamate--cysteine ligase